MKLLILVLVLAISAQPLQVGACDMDMDKSQETTQQTEQSGSDGHDCCDTEEADSQDNCGAGVHCGMCFVSVSAVPVIPRVISFWSHPVFSVSSTGVILPSHSSPPFRPPIA